MVAPNKAVPNPEMPLRRGVPAWVRWAVPLVVHAVGAVGLALPQWQGLFLALTPWQLLGAGGLVLAGHRPLAPRFGAWAALAFGLGMAFEVAGVHTGAVFGEYAYGSVLGPQLWGVPWVIGLNWALLAYGCGAWAQARSPRPRVWVPLAAGLMVGLDVAIEPVAIALGFWHWGGGLPPLHNYVGWAAVALLIQLGAAGLGVRYTSPWARPVLAAMALFFVGLALALWGLGV